MIKPDEHELTILYNLLVSSKRRASILSKIVDPRYYFRHSNCLEVYAAILEIKKENGELDLESISLKCDKTLHEFLKDLVKSSDYKEIPPNNIDSILNDARKNVLESDFVKKIHLDLSDILKDPKQSIENKVKLLRDTAAEVDVRLAPLREGPLSMIALLEQQDLIFKQRMSGMMFWKTGEPRLDKKLTYGWKPGEITFIAGRPYNGKSIVSLHLAKLCGNLNIPTLLYNFEMSNENSMDRLISMQAGVDITRLVKHYHQLETKEIEAIQRGKDVINKMSLSMYDKTRLTLDEWIIDVEKFQALIDSEYMVVFIDLFTKLKDFGNATGPLDFEKICNRFQDAVKSLGIHAVPIVQMQRASDQVNLRNRNDIPKIYPNFNQIKNSGAMEEIADNILLVCRPSYYSNRIPGVNIPDHIRMDLAKQRAGSSTTYKDPIIFRLYPSSLALCLPDKDWDPMQDAASDE